VLSCPALPAEFGSQLGEFVNPVVNNKVEWLALHGPIWIGPGQSVLFGFELSVPTIERSSDAPGKGTGGSTKIENALHGARPRPAPATSDHSIIGI